MGLKGITINEKSQSQEVAYCMIPFIEHSQNEETIEIEDELVVPGE